MNKRHLAASVLAGAGILLGSLVNGPAPAHAATTSTPAWAPAGMHALTTEDARNGYWDAAHRSNGKGLTYYVKAGHVTYTADVCKRDAKRAVGPGKHTMSVDAAVASCAKRVITKADAKRAYTSKYVVRIAG